MRVIGNGKQIKHLVLSAQRLAGLLEGAAGSPLPQITALETEAREGAGALNFGGDGPGVKGVENSVSRQETSPQAAPAGDGALLGPALAVSSAPLPAAAGVPWTLRSSRKHYLEAKIILVFHEHGCECVSFAIITDSPILL
jgi:hypothetical protein